jgi:hypothetical protein
MGRSEGNAARADNTATSWTMVNVRGLSEMRINMKTSDEILLDLGLHAHENFLAVLYQEFEDVIFLLDV